MHTVTSLLRYKITPQGYKHYWQYRIDGRVVSEYEYWHIMVFGYKGRYDT